LARNGIEQCEIRVTVAIEIGDSRNMPVWRQSRTSRTALQLRIIQIPNGGLEYAWAVKNEIWLTIPVKIPWLVVCRAVRDWAKERGQEEWRKSEYEQASTCMTADVENTSSDHCAVFADISRTVRWDCNPPLLARHA
jgi:hypothetical protein